MPTADEIREYQEWRAKIVNGIWDAQAADTTNWPPGVHTRDILPAISADQLPQHFVGRIINDLVDDGLVEGTMMVDEESHPTTVRLSSLGRMEVQRWISNDQPTEYFQVQPSQVFNTTTHFHGPVTGSALVVGSTGTTVNTQTAVGDSLPLLIEKARQLLGEWQGTDEDREGVIADIELLEEQSGSVAAPAGRTKAALRRMVAWAAGAAALGASSAISGEVQQLAGDVLQHL
jgi:hypothetical protein